MVDKMLESNLRENDNKDSREKNNRRQFLASLGKWSLAAVGVVTGMQVLSGEANAWNNWGWGRPGGSSRWVNHKGGGGGRWNNWGWARPGGGSRWANHKGGGGGRWNNWGWGRPGGSWANRHGGGGRWVNRR